MPGKIYNPGVMSVRHVLTILAVSDLRRAVSFYDAAFGWPKQVDTEVYVELDAGGQRFGLYQRDGFARNVGRLPERAPPEAITATEIYLYASDLEATLARLVSAGARPLSPLARRAWGDDVAYFADPDGNVVALARPG